MSDLILKIFTFFTGLSLVTMGVIFGEKYGSMLLVMGMILSIISTIMLLPYAYVIMTGETQ